MQIDDEKNKQILNRLESVLDVMSRIDLWLPKAIDEAVNGHHGRLDSADLKEMAKSKREGEKHNAEMNSLDIQIENSQKQTQEIAKQTKYVMWTLVLTTTISVLGFIWQIFKSNEQYCNCDDIIKSKGVYDEDYFSCIGEYCIGNERKSYIYSDFLRNNSLNDK